MREVAVIGIGQTKIDEHWDKSLRELAGEAVLEAVKDANKDHVDALFVGNMMSGSANHQQQLGAYIADWVGLRYSEAIKLESACSSSASAFRSALMAVSSGAIDSAVAIGIEKMSDSPGAEITSELSTAADADWEVSQGISFVALNALIMKRYMHEYGWQKSDFAPFSINAHANGVHNPYARFRKAITEKQYLGAGIIADPINLLDASPIGDGAAALLLVPVEHISKSNDKPTIKIIGSAAATDSIAVHGRRDPLWLSAAEKSSKKVYSQTGLKPNDIDVFESHDAFSIMAALSLEACGFAKRGKAPLLAINGDITPSGKIPIATRGGLKARGHPVGATGLYQLVEIVQQLRHTVKGSQVENAKIGMTQNIGGSGSNIVTHILQRVEN